MSKLYRIENRTSGADLGTYEAEDREAALQALADDAGVDRTDLDDADFIVTEVE